MFAVAWLIGQFSSDKTDEFQRSQGHVRRQVNARHPHATRERRDRMVRNAARRNTVGFAAYQVRHGWPDLWSAVHTGWADARDSHEEWRSRREEAGEGRPRARDAARAGWRGGWRGRRAGADDFDRLDDFEPQAERGPDRTYEPLPAPDEQNPEPQPSDPGDGPKGGGGQPTPGTDEVVTPFRQRDSTRTSASDSRGAPTMTTSGEAPGYTAAHGVTDSVTQAATGLASTLEQYEADLMAGGATRDPQVAATLAQMREHTNALMAALSAHKAALTSHESGHEYATSKGSGAAKTEWLGAG